MNALPAQQLGAGVTKRPTRMADGRELIYYDDPATTLGPTRAVDTRTLDPRPATAVMRLDVLTGDWISVAAARQNRAFLPPAHLDPLAPQTLTNPSEVPSRYDVVVFENKSPSFGPALADDGTPAAAQPAPAPTQPAPGTAIPPAGLADLASYELGKQRLAVGRCEVVCFSPDTHGSFGTQSVTRARTVIEAWADRTAALSALPGVQQVFPFENRGQEIGVTLPHPHGQIYSYPYITPRTQRLLESIAATGPDLQARILEFEHAGPRMLLQTEHWSAYVPFAARWPIEIHLMPHRQAPDFAALSAAERDELAPVYLTLLRAVDALYPTPTPYIAAWHQAPVHTARDCVRLHLEITSPRRAADKLKYLAGSEAAMGGWIADIVPEAAAERLRTAIDNVKETVK